MTVIDEVLQANGRYARAFGLGRLPRRPARKLAVVACMDARLAVEPVLGLQVGDAHIIRNSGGLVTDDALRSLLISHYLLGTEEWMIMSHTDCGMLTFKDEELLARLHDERGTGPEVSTQFHAFDDLEANTRRQIEKAKAHPWVPSSIAVRGFVYDVTTGRLNEVPT